MKYERLTIKRETPLVMSQWSGDSHSLKIYNRLAELEDKIESGELIERTSEEYSAVRKEAVEEFADEFKRRYFFMMTTYMKDPIYQCTGDELDRLVKEVCGECIGSVHGDPVGAPGADGTPAIKNIRETFSRPSTTCNKERTVPKGKAREYRRQKR